MAVPDKFAQKSIDVYRGFVQVYTHAPSASTTQSPVQYHTPTIRTSQPNTSAVGQLADDSRTKITTGQLQKVLHCIFKFKSIVTVLCEMRSSTQPIVISTSESETNDNNNNNTVEVQTELW
jgi:hypothetical protein